MSLYAIGAIVVVLIFFGVYRKSEMIEFAHYRANVSSLYCAVFKNSKIPDYPIIVVPGLKGSTLEKDGEIVWLSLKQIFESEPDSALALEDNDGIKATGVFVRVLGIPIVGKFLGYHRISLDMACAKNGYTYYYDWRKSPEDLIPDLSRLVQDVFKKTGKKPAVIAHSYGGLIVRGLMQNEPEALGPVAMVSTPFDPGPMFLTDDISRGAVVSGNKMLLSAPVTVSHDSSYYLIPLSDSRAFRDEDVSMANVWKKYKLGPYAFDAEYPEYELQAKLDRAQKFRETIRATYIGNSKVLIVRNNKLRTQRRINNFGDIVYGVGDGRVGFEAATPFGISAEQLTYYHHRERHSLQLQNKEILNRIYSFISTHTED
ncbi:MAG: hypothetical protein Q8Q18_00330 [bacterium]|nr:hypothetical protein [bacterium]